MFHQEKLQTNAQNAKMDARLAQVQQNAAIAWMAFTLQMKTASTVQQVAKNALKASKSAQNVLMVIIYHQQMESMLIAQDVLLAVIHAVKMNQAN